MFCAELIIQEVCDTHHQTTTESRFSQDIGNFYIYCYNIFGFVLH